MGIDLTSELFNDKIETRKRFIDYVFAALIATFLFSLFGLQKFAILLILNKLSAGLIILISIVFVRKFYFTDVHKWYLLFIFVTLITGALFAADLDLHFDMVAQIVQLFLLLVAIAQFYIYRGNIELFLIAQITVGILLCVAGRFLDPEMVYQGKLSRYSSISANSNGFAFQLLFSSLSALYFFRKPSLLIKIGILALVGFFSYYIALSGSRKSSLAFVILIVSWVFFSFPLKKSVQIGIGMLFFALLAGSYLYTVFEDTPVIQRFAQLEEDSGGTDIRTMLYREAFGVFQDYPVFGVGLNNFRVYSSSGLYAHSNYMEILADTGIIGFAIYFFIYFMIWRKGSRIQKIHEANESSVYVSGLFRSLVVLALVLGLGAVFYNNISHWIMLMFPVMLYEREKLLAEEIEEEEEAALEMVSMQGEV